MIARELISESIYPAKTTDSAEQVIDQLEIYRLNELPVLDEEGEVVGIINMKDLETMSPEDIIGESLHIGLIDHVAPIAHISDIIRQLGERSWSMMPVLNKEGKYRGIISQEDIFRAFSTSFSIRENGAIIVIETRRTAYSMSEVAQIVESENAAIISCYLSDGKDQEHIRITLKVNKLDIQFVLSTLERYGYDIIASFTSNDYTNTLKDRYDHLMTYLNV